MKIKTLITLLVACSPLTSLAHNLTVGEILPAAKVDSYGELVLEGDDISYQSWQTDDMLGKVRVVQAVAGRSSAKKLNAPMMAAITAAKFPAEQYQTTSIVNQDDAIWGTGAFVKSSIADSKREFPWSSMVLDENGVVAASWQLAPESSAIIVLDKQGQVQFVKEGALKEEEISQVIALIKQQL
ncbi:YtfJ family protein [Vibrio sp.]|uniref:YtfJ family protein n=1 Tax=Vibrio sp. TaxID=678 RepID=UPI003D0E1555